MRKRLFGVLVLFFASGWILAQTGTITSPKANDVWMLGDTKAITWTHTGQDTVKLFLLDQNKKKLGIIKSALQLSAGSWPWKVGSLEGGATVLPAKGYKIQMKMAGEAVILDPGAGPFEIASATVIPPAPLPPPAPPSNQTQFVNLQKLKVNRDQMLPMLRVSKPANGAQFFPGDTCTIAWTLPGDYPKVMILHYPSGQPQLAAAGQGVWITQDTNNDGAFDWTLSGLERTGKFVVRVMSLDGKVQGDSGEFTIGHKPLPPDQQVRVVAADVDTLLAQSASISIVSLHFHYSSPGVMDTVTVKVRVDATSAFVLSSLVGHPQFGSLYLRCHVQNPQTDPAGAFSVVTGYDRIVSLKGGGASEKIKSASPGNVPKGTSEFDIVFSPQTPVPLKGQLVVQKMPRDFLGAGNLCKQTYFPKATITVHLVTKSGEAVTAKMDYMHYSPAVCSLTTVTLPGEINACQEGVQDW